MACFTVPLAEAVIVTVVKAVILRKNADSVIHESKRIKIETIREKIEWLEKMLYGGSFLLAIEHLYHGEISFIPPFLTAMKTPEEIPVMLHEMATVGVGMALLTSVVWGIMVGVSTIFSKCKDVKLGVQGGIA